MSVLELRYVEQGYRGCSNAQRYVRFIAGVVTRYRGCSKGSYEEEDT